ncbi:MAG TPA: phosphoribosylformylglycinamidine cyclo-ligase, partial [Candidatus Binatia bacterium]|nr:phosphoribosylformylglycinamidine cyclo-ligase [Candidatus Binatia bacterium]
MAKKPITYQSAGVDAPREELVLQRIIKHFRKTWPQSDGLGSVKLDIGYFANVIDIGGVGLAITADGVGTKLLIAQLMQDYKTIGIDCVAMNVNDLLCVGAKPISMVDYIAVQEAKPDLLEDIAIGLCEGAKRANISIPGGEIAQLRDVIKGHKEGYGFDLAGMAVGIVPLDGIIVGQNIQEGDLVIGIESNGVHSNGLTLARRVFFEQNTFTVDAMFPSLEASLGKELLKPTHIYVKEALDILDQGIPVKALVHITSDGFLNLTRVVAEVGYIIDELPEPPQIFSLIQSYGNITDEQMFTVYNMGI